MIINLILEPGKEPPFIISNSNQVILVGLYEIIKLKKIAFEVSPLVTSIIAP